MNPISIRSSLLLAALTLSGIGTCDAVHVDPDGRGQVLIFPYYTVNAGKTTLLTVINTRDDAKAVRVRFRESRNGAEVMAFNLYLAPRDVWTGAIAAPAAGEDYAQAAPASLNTQDTSCTVPQLPIGGSQDFYDFTYAGAAASDAGPHQLSRTREGFVEVIELGRIEDAENFAAADAIRRSARGDRSGCALLDQAWRTPGNPPPQGLWRNQPGLGVLSPDGGLQGSAIIVDVALGSSFSVPAVALDSFFAAAADCAPDCRGRGSEHLHSSPSSSAPTLADARGGAPDTAIADFHHQGQRQQMTFSGPDAGLKAVSAVLMKRHLDNTFHMSSAGALAARTEWVLTFPTKGLHLAQTTPAGRLPFRSAYGWDAQSPNWPFLGASGACEPLSADYGNREGARIETFSVVEFPTPPPRPPSPSLCHASQVVALNDFAANDSRAERLHETLRGDPPSTLLGSAHPLRWRTCKKRSHLTEQTARRFNDCDGEFGTSEFVEGWMRIELGDAQRNYLYSGMQPGTGQTDQNNLLLGLPAIGFAVIEYQGSGQPGVLANFSTLTEHGGEQAPAAGRVEATDPTGGWNPVDPR